MQNWKTPQFKKLIKAFLTLKDEKEMSAFFRDLCTFKELHELSMRLQIAQLLNEGASYREVAEKTGVSTTTVTRIAQWLEHGENGYKTVLDRLK